MLVMFGLPDSPPKEIWLDCPPHKGEEVIFDDDPNETTYEVVSVRWVLNPKDAETYVELTQQEDRT